MYCQYCQALAMPVYKYCILGKIWMLLGMKFQYILCEIFLFWIIDHSVKDKTLFFWENIMCMDG